MTTITEKQANDYVLGKTIGIFFKEYKIGQLLKKANVYKAKGVPAVQVLAYLLQLVFTKKSMYMNIANGTHTADFGKDVVYRLLNASLQEIH